MPIKQTAARLGQLGEQDVKGSNHGWTNTQGF